MNKPQQQESWQQICDILGDDNQLKATRIQRLISIERQRVLEEVRELVEGMVKTENAQEDQSVADSVYFNQQQNIGYNNALDDLLSAIKEIEDKTL